MTKPIYVMVDTDDVRAYLNNNRELIDDDESMTDAEVNAVIDRIVAKSSEGRLYSMIAEAFSYNRAWEMLSDCIDDCFYDFTAECLEELQ